MLLTIDQLEVFAVTLLENIEFGLIVQPINAYFILQYQF